MTRGENAAQREVIAIYHSFVQDIYEKYPYGDLVARGGASGADFDFFYRPLDGYTEPEYSSFVHWTSELEGEYLAKYGINFLVEL